MINEIDFQKILREALREGGEFADLFFERTRSILIICEEDRIEKVISGWDIGAGLRILVGGRTIYSFTNQITEKDLLHLAEIVSRAAKEGEEGNVVQPTRQNHPPISSPAMPNAPFPIEKHPQGFSIGEKVSVVKQANDVARRIDQHVRQVKVLYRDFNQNVSIVNSEGVLTEGERAGMVFSVQVVSAKGDVVQTGYEAVGGTLGFELFDLQPPEKVAEVAAKRSLLMLSARKAPMGRMAVVLSSEAGGTMIHEAIGHGLEADLAQQGLSVYSKRIGEKVASPLITVVDDPTFLRRGVPMPLMMKGFPPEGRFWWRKES